MRPTSIEEQQCDQRGYRKQRCSREKLRRRYRQLRVVWIRVKSRTWALVKVTRYLIQVHDAQELARGVLGTQHLHSSLTVVLLLQLQVERHLRCLLRPRLL